jgi:mannonate dehydratase
VRERFGPELHLLHDVHHRLTPIEVGRLAAEVEPVRLFWLEDATPAENQSALRLARQHSTTPLAIGEVFNTVWDAQALISEQLIDYLRMSVTHGGGISHMRKALAFAELYQVRSGMHGPADISPVGMAAALHLGLAIPNFGIQEHARYHPLTDEAFRQSWAFADGYLHPGERPGLGVELDDAVMTAHPYQTAYLPVARLTDGTVHNW